MRALLHCYVVHILEQYYFPSDLSKIKIVFFISKELKGTSDLKESFITPTTSGSDRLLISLIS